jgi:recombination protein RecA
MPLNLLEQLPSRVRRGAVEPAGSEATLSLGLGGLDAVLPDGGLPRGGVVELSVAGGAALSTSVALAACRSAQQEALERGGQVPWCAFVDPTGTLHGPGVVAAGVQLDRLLVVRPPLEAIGRVAVKLAESHAFTVLVVDTVGTVGSAAHVPLASWPRLVRRLSIAAAESSALLLLVTDRDARRALPLPVAMRLELSRPRLDRLTVRVAKERRGRVSTERTIGWDRVTMRGPAPALAPVARLTARLPAPASRAS